MKTLKQFIGEGKHSDLETSISKAVGFPVKHQSSDDGYHTFSASVPEHLKHSLGHGEKFHNHMVSHGFEKDVDDYHDDQHHNTVYFNKGTSVLVSHKKSTGKLHKITVNHDEKE